jgi:hypothetical protein
VVKKIDASSHLAFRKLRLRFMRSVAESNCNTIGFDFGNPATS